MRTDAIDWPAMLALAVRLGIRPADFWALSLKEWLWLSHQAAQSSGLSMQQARRLRRQIDDFEKGAGFDERQAG